jgi:hypothetical protein
MVTGREFYQKKLEEAVEKAALSPVGSFEQRSWFKIAEGYRELLEKLPRKG